jgi:hypothetical protein
VFGHINSIVVSPNQTNAASSPPFSTTSSSSQLIADTGCTGHYFTINGPATCVQPSIQPLAVLLPNGASILSSHTGELDIPHIPLSARLCHLFPGLQSGSLLSIGQLCDAGCIATFTATRMDIYLGARCILQGYRSHPSGHWLVDIPDPNTPKASDASNIPTSVPSFCLPSALHLTSTTPATECATNQPDYHPTWPPSSNQPVPTPVHEPILAPTDTNKLSSINVVVPSQLIADKVAFYHAALFSPVLSTWTDAVDAGHFATWPDLTSAQIRKYCPFSAATHFGHMDQNRANLNTTKPNSVPNPDTEQDTKPTPTPDRTHAIFVATHQVSGQVHSDQTGRFPLVSTSGHNYIMVLYDYDSNYIHAATLRSRSGPDILAAYQTAHALLLQRGLKPQLQRLDNEASNALLQYMATQNVDVQLSPPHIHRRNAAERAIRTFKNHFVAGLCSTDVDFPMQLWDRLIPQAVQTLNLLRKSRLHPQMSAYAHLHGPFDFNRTPLAPPGIKVLIHEKPTVRGTWAPHAVPGWYLGPAMHHYRCYRVWARTTRAERITDTLVWVPTTLRVPVPSPTDRLQLAALDLVAAITAQHPPHGVQLHLSDSTREALRTLTTIFSQCIQPAHPGNQPGPPTMPVPAVPPPAPPPRVVPHPAPPHAAPYPAPPPRVALLPNEAPVEHAGHLPPPQAFPIQPPDQPIAPAAVLQLEPPPVPLPQPFPAAAPTTTSLHRTRMSTQGGRIAYFDPRTHRLTHWAQPDNAPQIAPNQHPLGLPQYHIANSVTAASPGRPRTYHQLLQGPEGHLWRQGASNEIGRLAQGVLPHMPEGTNTIHFIAPTELPVGRKPTYLRVVAEYKPHKAETHRIRFTCGGDRVDYPGVVATETADLTTAKLLFNSVISTPGARFAAFDIKNFYLNNPMPRYEYMWIPLRDIPADIKAQYNLAPLARHDKVLVEIRKGMYGLPQAGIIANTRLQAHLNTHGYHSSPNTPGLFRHKTRPITFTLVVDDFGVKYVGRQHADHLLQCLQEIYTVTTDWEGTKYCGLTLEWDYTHRQVHVSMPGYVAKALHRFQHPNPRKPEHSPHAWTAPSYGTPTQLSLPPDTTTSLLPAEVLRLQEVIGVLLFYARAVDCTMLVALGTLATAKTTQATAQGITQLLNYAATHPDAIITYHASDMALHVHSDASYQSESLSRSRAGGYFFLSSSAPTHTTTINPNAPPPPHNGPVHVPCTILKVVVSSAAEAELGALFHNGKEAAWLRTTLDDMGHPQTATPMQTDNSCAAGIANGTVKQRRSKAIDMRFYWVRDRVRQNQFNVHWRRGVDNLADYFTKHHSTAHHRLMRSRYLVDLHRPSPVIRSGEGVFIPYASSRILLNPTCTTSGISVDGEPGTEITNSPGARTISTNRALSLVAIVLSDQHKPKLIS